MLWNMQMVWKHREKRGYRKTTLLFSDSAISFCASVMRKVHSAAPLWIWFWKPSVCDITKGTLTLNGMQFSHPSQWQHPLSTFWFCPRQNLWKDKQRIIIKKQLKKAHTRHFKGSLWTQDSICCFLESYLLYKFLRHWTSKLVNTLSRFDRYDFYGWMD